MQLTRSGVPALLAGLLMLSLLSPVHAAPRSDAGAAAAALPPQCIEAGINARGECEAFLRKGTTGPSKKPSLAGQQPSARRPVEKPPRITNSAKTGMPTGPLPADCAAAGLTTKAECDGLHRRGKDGNRTTDVVKRVTPPPAAGGIARQNPPGAPLPAECIAAGLKTMAECKAFRASNTSGKPLPRTDNQAGGAASTPNRPTESNKPGKLAPDCIKAGITTAAQCDALHAINSQKGRTTPSTSQPPVGRTSVQQEPIAKLPKGVAKSQVAPLFDSAKQVRKGAVAPGAAPVPPAATKPPKSDKLAQLAINPSKLPPIDQQKGERIDPAKGGHFVRPPSDVTIVNQTVVNNNIYVSNVKNYYGPWGQDSGASYRRPPPNPIGLGIGVVLEVGGQLIVSSPGLDQYRIAYADQDQTYYDSLPGGLYRATIVRPDGTRIVTLYDADGDILRRSRFDPDGHEVVLAYFDYAQDPDLMGWRDPGDDLPPLQLDVAVDDYVLDADQASEADVLSFFGRPPIEPLRRLYSIGEVERSARLRDIMPRLELGDLTFDTGAATIAPDQVDALSNVASAMLALLKQNPAETFLIEGHTDAVGSPASNLQLSDARAATVAGILTGYYHIPPENLVTQGYGSEFPRIQTSGPERLNRRVVIRRITPLITLAAAQ